MTTARRVRPPSECPDVPDSTHPAAQRCRQEATPPAPRGTGLARALRDVSYEVLPFLGTEDAVLEHVPCDVRLTVTATESKGLARTVELAARLAGHGYSVAPHLAARQIRDDTHLDDLVTELREAGVDSVFVVGGDAPNPTGRFTEAAAVLEALHNAGHTFRHVGIGGYPEGHPRIDDAALGRALAAKAPYATHLITQLCFDAATTSTWAKAVAHSGIQLPIRVGLPGVVSRQKLIRISAGLGLGQSARFLLKQQNMLWRFFLPGGYRPDRLLDRLVRDLDQPANPIEGFHLFTFNELEKTESWRRGLLARAELRGNTP